MKSLMSMMLGALLVGPAAAQDDKAEAAKEPAPVSLRVQFVMSRSQGERKVASYPYVLSLSTGRRQGGIRMGNEVPIPVTLKDGSVSFQYRNVGTNLECTPEALGGGRYRLQIQMENSSAGEAVAVTPQQSAPMFVTRNTRSDLILRDGETQLFSSAVEPVTGDVVKIEVTLTVLK